MHKIIQSHSLQLIIRFASVGAIATLIHAIVYILFLKFLEPQLSNLLGYLIALICSYLGQSKVTFKQGDIWNYFILLKFIGVSLFGFALNALWVHITSSILIIDPKFAILGIGFLTPMISFIFLKYWVFKHKPKQ